MTEPAWAPHSLPEPVEPAGRGGPRSWVLPLLGCLPAAIAVALWLRALPTTVRTEAELAAVGFGWPFAWTVQDQTRYSPQSFPMTAEYVGPKGMAEPLVTHIDWVLFAANSAILWAVACAVLILAVRIRRTAGPDPSAAEPQKQQPR